jgi:hypothetical protein
MPHPFLELFPPESSPRKSRQPLSGPHTPSRLSACVLSCTARGRITTGFPGTVPKDDIPTPPMTMGPLSLHLGARPGRPGSRIVWPARSTGFTRLEVFLLLRVRSRRFTVALKRRPFLSWVFSPLKYSLSTPRGL